MALVANKADLEGKREVDDEVNVIMFLFFHVFCFILIRIFMFQCLCCM